MHLASGRWNEELQPGWFSYLVGVQENAIFLDDGLEL